MLVKEIMTANPEVCNPAAKLNDVARMMVDCDCGAIPVVSDGRPVGIITDRDIVCRTVAKGQNPLESYAEQVMTPSIITVKPETDVKDCIRIMEEHQVRRIIVTDNTGKCLGIVAQADIALSTSDNLKASLVEEISK